MSIADISTEYAFLSPEDRQHCVDVALDAIKSSHLLRVPRTPEDRQNAFVNWIAQWRVKLEPSIYAILRQEAPNSCALLSEQTLSTQLC